MHEGEVAAPLILVNPQAALVGLSCLSDNWFQSLNTCLPDIEAAC
jgi:hypothetical protein